MIKSYSAEKRSNPGEKKSKLAKKMQASSSKIKQGTL